jgi:hypothetical protein
MLSTGVSHTVELKFDVTRVVVMTLLSLRMLGRRLNAVAAQAPELNMIIHTGEQCRCRANHKLKQCSVYPLLRGARSMLLMLWLGCQQLTYTLVSSGGGGIVTALLKDAIGCLAGYERVRAVWMGVGGREL